MILCFAVIQSKIIHRLAKNFYYEINILIKGILLQVTFEGIRGSSYTGDAAIDDVSIANGSCGGPPPPPTQSPTPPPPGEL